MSRRMCTCLILLSSLFLLLAQPYPSPIFQFAGSSIDGYTVRNSIGVGASPDWCGKSGGALSLSGGAFLSYDGSVSEIPVGTVDASIALWLNCQLQPSNQANRRTVFYFGGSASQSSSHFAAKVYNGSTLIFSGGDSPRNDCSTNSSMPICDGTWHHVAMSFTAFSGVLAIYVGGVLSIFCQLSNPLVLPANPSLFIGSDGRPQFFTNGGASTGEVWIGLIANARIFNYTLSESAVAADEQLCASSSSSTTPSQSASATASPSTTPSQSQSPSQTATPLTCRVMPATLCTADDILVTEDVYSSADCCTACGSLSGCFAWTWNAGGDLSCHLKGSCGTSITSVADLSGIKEPSATPSPAATSSQVFYFQSPTSTPSLIPTISLSGSSTQTQSLNLLTTSPVGGSTSHKPSSTFAAKESSSQGHSVQSAGSPYIAKPFSSSSSVGFQRMVIQVYS